MAIDNEEVSKKTAGFTWLEKIRISSGKNCKKTMKFECSENELADSQNLVPICEFLLYTK